MILIALHLNYRIILFQCSSWNPTRYTWARSYSSSRVRPSPAATSSGSTTKRIRPSTAPEKSPTPSAARTTSATPQRQRPTVGAATNNFFARGPEGNAPHSAMSPTTSAASRRWKTLAIKSSGESVRPIGKSRKIVVRPLAGSGMELLSESSQDSSAATRPARRCRKPDVPFRMCARPLSDRSATLSIIF